MAPVPSSKAFIKFILSAYFSLIIISLALKKGNALEESSTHAEINFHSVHISSLLPPSACKSTSSKGPKGKTALKVVHKHGPCHQGETNPPSLAQILDQDRSRVTAIQARKTSNSKPDRTGKSKAKLSTTRGASLGSGNYIVTIGLGTPKKPFTVNFDTGSGLTWIQCQPCLKYCYPQAHPVFDPSKSSTYSNISCTSPQCSQLLSATGNEPGCYNSTCAYGIQYADQSFSVGFFAKDTLTLASDAIPNFLFGCGENNQGSFGMTDGLLGIGRDFTSVVSQTSQKFGKVFSYCLPTVSGSNGYLRFGKYKTPKTVKFTPFSKPSNEYYFVTIQGISVGGAKLPINSSVFLNPGTVIDSGTVLTRLPAAAYSALSTAFRHYMTNYTMTLPFEILDTCYDVGNQTAITIPNISFFFNGNVRVDLAPEGILVAVNPSQVCLAFVGNTAASDFGIFGNLQQQKLQVVYDVAGEKLGFGAGGCS